MAAVVHTRSTNQITEIGRLILLAAMMTATTAAPILTRRVSSTGPSAIHRKMAGGIVEILRQARKGHEGTVSETVKLLTCQSEELQPANLLYPTHKNLHHERRNTVLFAVPISSSA